MADIPTIEEAEKLLGSTRDNWEWQCHAISFQLAPHVGGVVRRGFFHGPTTKPVFQHSWIELPDGSVLDPTCHAFTDRPPLWHGPADEYDIAGCKHAPPSPPAPRDVDGDDPVTLDFECAASYVANLVGLDTFSWEQYDDDDDGAGGYCCLTVPQVFWLANLPVKEEERPGVLNRFFAAEVYEAIIAADWKAAIPIDKLAWILPEAAPGYQPKPLS